jgi:glutathione synthase/RimK-type ligase-like ATP-grasp enzyme
MMKKFLIITHSNDNECIEVVMKKLEAHNAIGIRFNVDEYPINCAISSCYENEEWKTFIHSNGERTPISDITGLWFRRAHNLGKGLGKVIESNYYAAAMGEIRTTFFGFLEGLDCFHIGKYSHYRRLDSKEEQLKLASELGLKVPDTCITNSSEEAKRFVAMHPNGTVVKMQSSFAIDRDGDEHVVFTNLIKTEDLDDIENLQYCPMQFQEKLEKAVELRVTVVGDQVFTFAIDSQKLDRSKLDWRREGNTLLKDWVPYNLPTDVQEKVLQLMDIYQLNYGAIDIIVTPKNEHYFLEINAAGEYFWLDRLVDGAISDQIVKILLDKAPRRYTPRLGFKQVSNFV